MPSAASTILSLCATGGLAAVAYGVYLAFIKPRFNPLARLPGPKGNRFIEMRHLGMIMDPRRSPSTYVHFVREYGRNVYIRGPLPWDQRLFTLDPVAMNHVLQHTSDYQKPETSRRLISQLIGVGMLSAEGHVHKRQRRVATPAFSIQAMRDLVPLVFDKAVALRDKWSALMREANIKPGEGHILDVCNWASRVTFDVMGSAGFDYELDAIHNGDNELLRAYTEMFDVAITRNTGGWWDLITLHVPLAGELLPSKAFKFVSRCREVIHRVAGRLIQEKKRKIMEAQAKGQTYGGKDLLSLLLKFNESSEIPPEHHIPDEDILNTINTFIFAGTDTTSLALTWSFFLLSHYPDIQTRLRNELLFVLPTTPLQDLTADEVQSLYTAIAQLPYLDNVTKEVLRLIPPIHSSLRVATRDDYIPISSPIKRKDKNGNISLDDARSIYVPKGTFIYVPIEGFNLDKELWGESAWAFNPDRWDDLPESIKTTPGLYNHLLTFSAGPRACIGMRMAIIEFKVFMFMLLTNFVFSPAPGQQIGKANVVLTRPYVAGREKEGSMLPLLVTPYVPSE
ncbi:cytochrome P450 [Irpex rosettiformis]|uniref:Cytochrome P450 n=1 Tax=Irpex rosettiformis TaxID=378272 RepID=A0ACB8U7U7_9APHY|nr:cytochrome P450 [Irpex rosettiformis]